MQPPERNAVAAIYLMLAFADGGKAGEERARIKRILDGPGKTELPQIYQRLPAQVLADVFQLAGVLRGRAEAQPIAIDPMCTGQRSARVASN